MLVTVFGTAAQQERVYKLLNPNTRLAHGSFRDGYIDVPVAVDMGMKRVKKILRNNDIPFEESEAQDATFSVEGLIINFYD